MMMSLCRAQPDRRFHRILIFLLAWVFLPYFLQRSSSTTTSTSMQRASLQDAVVAPSVQLEKASNVSNETFVDEPATDSSLPNFPNPTMNPPLQTVGLSTNLSSSNASVLLLQQSTSNASLHVDPSSSSTLPAPPNNTTTATPGHNAAWSQISAVHGSVFPVLAAGRWTKRPDFAHRTTAAHTKCYRRERQGSCLSKDGFRYIVKGKQNVKPQGRPMRNGPEISAGFDPYVWESDLYEYSVLPPPNFTNATAVEEERLLVSRILRGRRFHLVGDSLSRQWAQLLQCRLQLDYPDTGARVLHYMTVKHGLTKPILKQLQPYNTSRDFLILNMGHHMDPSQLGDRAYRHYHATLQTVRRTKFPMPDANVYFRTTCPGFHVPYTVGYDATKNNTPIVKIGTLEANNSNTWDIEGRYQYQPAQNLHAVEVLGDRFKILDIAPLMLARSDALFDGTHWCLPGPHEYWTRMMLFRIWKEHGVVEEEQPQ